MLLQELRAEQQEEGGRGGELPQEGQEGGRGDGGGGVGRRGREGRKLEDPDSGDVEPGGAGEGVRSSPFGVARTKISER